MKFLKKMKDGGAKSTVVGYWLIELKTLFSICLLNFQGKSREAYHTHAFNSISWVLKGGLREDIASELNKNGKVRYHWPSWKPIITYRNDFHKVDSVLDNSWVLTFRGPWVKNWKEYHPETQEFVTLSPGRVEVERMKSV